LRNGAVPAAGRTGNAHAVADHGSLPCIPTRVDYVYRTDATPSAFAPWTAGATTYPTNMARTAAGRPYIIRVETGTINRGIYQILMLHDPLAQPSEPNWRNPSANWNGRLVYTFGGGCNGGFYRQGANTNPSLLVYNATDPFLLSQGFAIATSTLNVPGVNCNMLTSAETTMMVKERFIEGYGPPVHTMGFGCSGGAYAQHEVADNYPGLLDGIIVGCSFPDVTNSNLNMLTDSLLLDTYFKRADIGSWTTEQKRQVTGFGVLNSIAVQASAANRIDPDGNCGIVPVEMRYNALTNPTGARCTVFDHAVNVFGTDPTTGFARRPLDNEGIQYGLQVLNSGVIGVEQFLDLNGKIGGFDRDANIVSQRTHADLPAVRIAYQTGRVLNGGGGLASIPIIDYRAYTNDLPNGDVHMAYHSFSLRERLENANGRSDNQIMLVEDFTYNLMSTDSPLVQHAVLSMERWLDAIKADTRDMRQIDKVVLNKPLDLVEGCNTRGPNPTFIQQTLVREQEAITPCNQLYPTNSFPREVAGEDIAADVVKCRRKPLDPSDYSVTFTPAQWNLMQTIFSTGVCDWSRPGYRQQGLKGTWLSYD
jgi:hypothetical protein